MSRSKKLKVAEYSPSNNKAKGKIKLSEKLEECLRWFEEGNFVDLCIDVCNQFGNFYPSDIFGSSIKQGVIRELYAKGLIKKTLIEVYGVKAVQRPKVPARKKLDLSGEFGQQIVKSETKLVLRTHKRTFEKLAYM